jgi:hypothetical protein
MHIASVLAIGLTKIPVRFLRRLAKPGTTFKTLSFKGVAV